MPTLRLFLADLRRTATGWREVVSNLRNKRLTASRPLAVIPHRVGAATHKKAHCSQLRGLICSCFVPIFRSPAERSLESGTRPMRILLQIPLQKQQNARGQSRGRVPQPANSLQMQAEARHQSQPKEWMLAANPLQMQPEPEPAALCATTARR